MLEHDKYFNKAEALQRVRGNEKTLRLMINMFLASKEVAQLESSLANKEIETAAQMVHAVKGLSGNLSFPLLFEASDRLNLELKDQIYNEVSVAEYRQILAETQQVVREILAIEA